LGVKAEGILPEHYAGRVRGMYKTTPLTKKQKRARCMNVIGVTTSGLGPP